MNNNTNNNLNQENNQTTQNNVPVVQPVQATVPVQTTPTVQPVQATVPVQTTPAVQQAQPTVPVQTIPAIQQTQPTVPVQTTPAVQPTQESPTTQPLQQDIIVQAPPEPTVSVTQTEHPKEKKNNKKLIIIIIIILIIAIIGLVLFLNKDKFLNQTSNDKNNQTENTNNNSDNNTSNDTNNNSNNNPENNQQTDDILKDAFINTAKLYANATKTLWSADAISCNNINSSGVDDGDYYIMIDTRDGAKENLPLLLEQGGKSSWNESDLQGYVRINIETIDNNRISKFYVSLTDGIHTISDDNTLTSDEIQNENIIMTTDTTLLNKVKMTTDVTDDSGNYTGTSDCTWDTINNKYTCTNFTGYGQEAVDKIKGICIEQ